jgi:hypothetical protein
MATLRQDTCRAYRDVNACTIISAAVVLQPHACHNYCSTHKARLLEELLQGAGVDVGPSRTILYQPNLGRNAVMIVTRITVVN